MEIKIVYTGNTPHIYFDDKEISEVHAYYISQGVNEPPILHLDIVALNGIKIQDK